MKRSHAMNWCHGVAIWAGTDKLPPGWTSDGKTKVGIYDERAEKENKAQTASERLKQLGIKEMSNSFADRFGDAMGHEDL